MLKSRCLIMLLTILFISYFGERGNCKDAPQRNEGVIYIDAYRANRRKKARDLWITFTDNFARQIDSNQAWKILYFVKNHSILVVPHLEGIIGIEGPKENDANWIRFLPVIESEDKETLFWREYLEGLFKGSYGTYQPEYKTIILTDFNSLNDFNRGIVFFLAGCHALNYQQDPTSDWKNEKVFSTKDVEAYEFMAQIFKKIGGAPYDKILQREFQDFHLPLSTKLLIQKNLLPDLEKIFGKVNSDKERNFLLTNFGIILVFNNLEKNFKGETLKEEKRKFMKKIMLH